jgi:hypothetical protein
MRRILAIFLLSSFALTAAAATSSSEIDASAPTSRPISTGVTSPRLVHSQPITIPADALQASTTGPLTVELSLKLDETGTPTDIHVTRSLNQQADARIVSAVRQFRWTPAVLNNKTIPLDLNLIVNVQR